MREVLAPYACNWRKSRGRQYFERESPNRSSYQRDRDRIIHSGAFRRLKHKTQVFVYHVGDYYRTRLTHSLEVSQIARSICRILNLDEDLAEAISLAHDLGHTPFGHAGEFALDKEMKPWGGFDHNAQTIRILTKLEHRYAEFDGLNLSWETLEGVVKHNGPLIGRYSKFKNISRTIINLNKLFDLRLDIYPSAEAQVASLADDIAYNNHDIDDGLRAGFFTIDDLKELPVVGDIVNNVISLYGRDLERSRLSNEIIRRTIDYMISDVLEESLNRVKDVNPKTSDDVRGLNSFIINFSEKMQKDNIIIKKFLNEFMYRHPSVKKMSMKAETVTQDLFRLLISDYDKLPLEWQSKLSNNIEIDSRLVADYLSGMTDRYALRKHNELCVNL